MKLPPAKAKFRRARQRVESLRKDVTHQWAGAGIDPARLATMTSTVFRLTDQLGDTIAESQATAQFAGVYSTAADMVRDRADAETKRVRRRDGWRHANTLRAQRAADGWQPYINEARRIWNSGPAQRRLTPNAIAKRVRAAVIAAGLAGAHPLSVDRVRKIITPHAPRRKLAAT